MDDKTEKVALFRYGLIAPLVLETLPRGELTRRAQQIAARLYDFPHSTRRQVSVDTLLDWTLRYRRDGLEALSPKTRQDRGHARAVASDTAALIERLKRENPHRTGAALLRELATASEAHQAGLSASTLYRFLRARGLTERQLLLDKATAHKKYEAQFANQIWQSDMLFGPWVGRPGGGKQQVFLQAALDDASRLIPHAQFYPNQGLDAFLDCLRQAIAARGIPTRLYMDNAKIYRSPQLARIAASIGILIVHTPPYQPEGRGKIERFFRSVREQFLASLDPKVLLSLEQLNERLWHWLDTDYHRREHSSLQTTPLLRWQRDIEQVRQLPPATDLRRLFFHRVDRLVRKDSTFLLKNRFFEAPSHLAGKRIEVRFDPLDLTRREACGETLVVCPTHKEIAAVTEAIRADRRAHNELGDDHNRIRLEPLNFTEAQKRDMRNYEPGQVLVFHRPTKHAQRHEAFEIVSVKDNAVLVRNESGTETEVTQKQARSFGVFAPKEIAVAPGDVLLLQGNRRGPDLRATNGEFVEVAQIDAEQRMHLKDGRVLPTDYQCYTHGYAITAHKSQGKTVDHVIISGNEMGRELFYVAASRGRYGVQVFTEDAEALQAAAGVTAARQSATELAQHAIEDGVDISKRQQWWIDYETGAPTQDATRAQPQGRYQEKGFSR